MPVAKVILAYQARGSVEFQEFNAYLCADGTLELGSVCDKFGLRSIELDGVLVPGDATHSPETYAPGMRIQVSGSIQLAAAPCQVNPGSLLGTDESWSLKAKLQVGNGTTRRQLQVDFMIDTSCVGFDAIIPCRKAQQLGLTKCKERDAIALGGTKVHVYRYSPAVEILVPLWASGLHGGAPLQDVRTAWFEVWGMEEELQGVEKVAMLSVAHDTEEDSSSSVSSDVGGPSTPTRQYEGVGIEQFSPLTQSTATAIIGVQGLGRLRLQLDPQGRRVVAISALPRVM